VIRYARARTPLRVLAESSISTLRRDVDRVSYCLLTSRGPETDGRLAAIQNLPRCERSAGGPNIMQK
jgi:hypothetical protein